MREAAVSSISKAINILLVEDQVLHRLAVATMLETDGFRVVAVASAEEALEVLGAGFDIRALITDVELSPYGLNGFELAQIVHERHQLGLVVMSDQASPEAGDLPPGARFVAKPVHRATLRHLVGDVISSANRAIEVPNRGSFSAMQQSPILTPRQHEVLELLVQGKSNRDIAEVMGLSENTVKVHLAAIFRALGVSSRTEALLAGLKQLRIN
jgi:DNA-binding NarL/FixJ family response regulator